MSYASIAFHFDSLGEAYGFPAGYRDPSFTEIARRFFEISDRYGFRYTIFMIGRDLQSEENRAAVGRWSQEGHEIGSHSMNHRFDFGALKKSVVRSELKEAHELILQATGQAPKGFAAPAWSTSQNHIEALEELGYSYDASMMPSWIRWAMLANTLVNYLGTRRVYYCVHQKHLTAPLFASRKPVTSKGGLLMMPLPTDRFRFASWHTVSFLFGWKAHERILRRALDEIEAFYYVVHPADMLSDELLRTDMKIHLARVHVPLDVKRKYLEQSIEIILKSGRKLVTMGELAERTRARRDAELPPPKRAAAS